MLCFSAPLCLAALGCTLLGFASLRSAAPRCARLRSLFTCTAGPRLRHSQLRFATLFACYVVGKVIAHTHDDVGWLKTVDEYYSGTNSSITLAGVQWILDSVITSLEENPERVFNYVEQAFFQRWWREQDASMQARVRALVDRKQLVFVEGGWSMPDEANPTFTDWIDTMTLGLKFIKDEFGPEPAAQAGRVLWQLDPFGHSRTVAMAAAKWGADIGVMGRIDYDDMLHREQTKTMEFVWKTSPSLGQSADLFTLKTSHGYNPPDGFCFDIRCGNDPIQDDPRLENVNIQAKADAYVKQVLAWADWYTSDNVMIFAGTDFTYQQAGMWFKSMDKLMGYIQNRSEEYGVNIFYSTPQTYVDYVHAANLTYTYKTDDFFPYADYPAAYWSGYFTSRPALKGYVRTSSAFLRECRQLEAFAYGASPSGPVGSSLSSWEAQGVLQHHDAVAGTEQQHVAYDYAKRLSIAHAECASLTEDAVARLTEAPYVGRDWSECPRANVSLCPATQTPSPQGVAIVLYNQVTSPLSTWHRVPVDSDSWTVVNATGSPVLAQMVANPAPLPDRDSASKYTLTFFAENLPPMGYATYFMVPGTPVLGGPAPHAKRVEVEEMDASPVVENADVRLTFDESTGLLQSYVDKRSGVETKLNQYLAYYNASAGEHVVRTFDASGHSSSYFDEINPGQAAGAYIMRVNSTTLYPINGKSHTASLSVHSGPHGTEVVQAFGSWAYQVIRLYAGMSVPEIEYTIGPIDIADQDGKEVISVWQSDIASGDTWYSDANAREVIQRKRDFRATWKLNCTAPVACNYNPVNLATYLEDQSRRLTLVTDRSNGGTSMAPGEMEVTLHRRLLFDDNRGVGQALNETGLSGTGLVIRAKHLFFVQAPEEAGTSWRMLGRQLTYRPRALYASLPATPQEWALGHRVSWSGLTQALPPPVYLQTFQVVGPNKVLLRLTHMYAAGESSIYSKPVSMDLTSVFKAFSITSWTELSLAGNMPVSKLQSRLKWDASGGPEGMTPPVRGGGEEVEEDGRNERGDGSEFVVELVPMETRTFELDVTWLDIAP